MNFLSTEPTATTAENTMVRMEESAPRVEQSRPQDDDGAATTTSKQEAPAEAAPIDPTPAPMVVTDRPPTMLETLFRDHEAHEDIDDMIEKGRAQPVVRRPGGGSSVHSRDNFVDDDDDNASSLNSHRETANNIQASSAVGEERSLASRTTTKPGTSTSGRSIHSKSSGGNKQTTRGMDASSTSGAGLNSASSYSSRSHGTKKKKKKKSSTAEDSCSTTTPPGVTLSRPAFCVLAAVAILGLLVGTVGAGFGIATYVQQQQYMQTQGSNNNNTKTDSDQPPDDALSSSLLLRTIPERGYIRCGFPVAQAGFFQQINDDEDDPLLVVARYEGMDVDLCRVLAAAVTGDATNYEVVPLAEEEQQWAMLKSGSVDVLMHTVYTMEHDVYIESVETGFEFTSPYFYDGLGFGGPRADLVTCAENGVTNGTTTCADLKVCIASPRYQSVVVNDDDMFPIVEVVSTDKDLQQKFPSECNVLAGGKIDVSEWTVRTKLGYNDNDQYTVGNRILSKEPISIAVRNGDPTWKDFVDLTLQSLIYAESDGITQATARTAMPTTDLFGPTLENAFRDAVAARGNYAEIYRANFENSNNQMILPRTGQNLLNGDGVSAPMMWAFPFGNLQVEGPPLEETSPTVRAIHTKGFLNCAKLDLAGFSAFDPVTRDYFGFDIDLCRAISAALFDGADYHTVLTDMTYTHRWEALQSGRVDIVTLASTWTPERDARERSTQVGFTFADVNCFFWYGFGGATTDYVRCAENLDVVSAECQQLRVCTYRDSTFFDFLLEQLGNDFYIVGLGSNQEIVAGLREGRCNVIFETNVNVQERMVRENGYGDELPFVIGTKQFNVEPSAVITRQDDQAWSDFVRWIFWALVYAEEQGITQATADRMPRTNLFGPFRTRAFYHAVNAVGNYGEMYARNVEGIFARAGLNELNDNTNPRIYAIPGWTS